MQTDENVYTPFRETGVTPPEKNTGGFRSDIIKFAFIFFLIIVPFRFFIAQPFVVSGASMDPTFHSGDYLIIDQITPKIRGEWRRFDVVVFKFPFQKNRYLIKRIIGLPGETITIVNGIITITGPHIPQKIILTEEPYVTYTSNDSHTVTLNHNEYFVLGDNRAGSYDSRSWGPLTEDLLVGEPLIRLFPFNAIDTHPGRIPQSI